MTDPAAEFQHLLNQKEIAACNLAAAVETVVLFWEGLSQEEVYERLQLVRAEYRQIEVRIAQFRKSQ